MHGGIHSTKHSAIVDKRENDGYQMGWTEEQALVLDLDPDVGWNANGGLEIKNRFTSLWLKDYLRHLAPSRRK